MTTIVTVVLAFGLGFLISPFEHEDGPHESEAIGI